MTTVPKDVTVDPGRSQRTQLLAAIVLSLAAMVSAFLLYFCIKRMHSKKYKNTLSMREIGLRRFSLGEIEKATKCFSKECLLGSGAFGNVYRGMFDGGKILAIKKAHVDSYDSILEFKNEVELLWRVKHPNLVGLAGFCQEADQKILVYEYVPNGCLLDYIAGRQKKPLTWMQRVHIAIGAAKGIAHLHEGVTPSIIHRDVKPSNILIGEGFGPKVSDFGLVKSGPVGDASHVSSQIKGTPGYLDPEYCSSYHLTTFSDVYSFGVILLQLISARRAVDHSRPASQYHIIDWARPSLDKGTVEEIIDADLLLEACNMEMMLKMGQLALKCVVNKPKNRPTMNQVAKELEEDFKRYAAPAISKQISNVHCKSIARQESASSISIDNVGLERFNIEEEDDISIRSVSMRGGVAAKGRIGREVLLHERCSRRGSTISGDRYEFCWQWGLPMVMGRSDGGIVKDSLFIVRDLAELD
ncbi:uncharacterized protein A4U43_C04F21970 [Asparagus officinalis]|uniref:non-specific serine/threonine protein kinase n=1 Tax=Asparagus officinalis TaxID=4686 RepID=A0A5P1F848_ASPOF|nr:uncharacterized protein A4U43_C04F21970 [Asparagus officinalis]